MEDNRVKEKGTRELLAKLKRNDRLMRVATATILTKAFELYHKMVLNASAMKCDISYEKKEAFLGELNQLFHTNVSPSELFKDEDEYSREALECYDALKKQWEYGIVTESVGMAFCKAMEHYEGFCWLKTDGYLYMPLYLDFFCGYLTGYLTKSELESNFVYFKLWEGGKPSKGNFALIRRTFRQVEELYGEIISKQYKRQF